MPTIASSTNDGYIIHSSTSNWAGVRDATSGTSVYSSATRSTNAVYLAKVTCRSGTVWIVMRSFFDFDTSGISVAPSSATLKIYGYSVGTAEVIPVKSTQGASLHRDDFDAITGWVAGADNDGNVTKYSSEITSWSTSGYNDFTLTASALSDMASLSTFKVCLINYNYDLSNTEPALGVTVRSGCYYTEYTGTSTDPYIDYTEAVATTDNSIFFGANF